MEYAENCGEVYFRTLMNFYEIFMTGIMDGAGNILTEEGLG